MIDIYRIVTEAQESEEEFIFTTIQPFCEDVVKREISKAELVKLLSQPKIVRCGECKYYSLTFECMKDECGIEEPPTWYCADGERRDDG